MEQVALAGLTAQLEEELRELTEENLRLRAASEMFGQLAERLNQQFQREKLAHAVTAMRVSARPCRAGCTHDACGKM
jgi:hypothetical protein